MVHGGSKPESLRAARQRPPTVVLTVGHSTRSQEDFIALLQAHAVKRLVDVRSIPHSRRTPQFNRERMASALRRAGISYLHMKNLGGLRHPRPDSPNTALRCPPENSPDLYRCPQCEGPMRVIERQPLPNSNFVLHPGSALRHETTLSNSKTPRSSARSVLLCLAAKQIPSSRLFNHTLHNTVSL